MFIKEVLCILKGGGIIFFPLEYMNRRGHVPVSWYSRNFPVQGTSLFSMAFFLVILVNVKIFNFTQTHLHLLTDTYYIL